MFCCFIFVFRLSLHPIFTPPSSTDHRPTDFLTESSSECNEMTASLQPLTRLHTERLPNSECLRKGFRSGSFGNKK